MHSSIANVLFRGGAALRNPSLTEEYERVKQCEWLSRSELEKIQVRRARAFMTFVGEHSPYYQRVFRDCGFHPESLSSTQEVGVLPTIDKDELIASNDEIHAQGNFSRSFTAETSGTTGSALRFQKNERWDSINRALMLRSYDWYGVKPWQRSGYLWGYDIDPRRRWKTKLFDILQNRFRMFTYDHESVKRFAVKLRSATYLAGYSSMIYEVAKIINDMEIDCAPLRLIKGTSEMILDAYQPEVERAFGHRIVSEYGAAEAGLIAFECPKRSMHINMEDVIVETDADGEIIVTNLASYSFPVIRYRLGDTVRLSNKRCSCGREHPILAEIIGRKGATIEGRREEHPALTFYYVFKNLALRQSLLLNYKAVQESPGSVIIFVEGRENRVHESVILKELEKYFGNDLAFELRFVQRFDRQKKKMQYFESRI